MQIKLFTIPVIGGEKLESELNTFLRSRKILHTDRQLVNNGQGAFWCFCITYIDSRNTVSQEKEVKVKPDYKKELDAPTFKRFTEFREIRKRLAAEESIPAYAVFTNAELVEIAKLGEERTLTKMQKISGIGKKKLEKFGHYFINHK